MASLPLQLLVAGILITTESPSHSFYFGHLPGFRMQPNSLVYGQEKKLYCPNVSIRGFLAHLSYHSYLNSTSGSKTGSTRAPGLFGQSCRSNNAFGLNQPFSQSHFPPTLSAPKKLTPVLFPSQHGQKYTNLLSKLMLCSSSKCC